VAIEPHADGAEVHWSAAWRDRPPLMLVALPGLRQISVSGAEGSVVLAAAGNGEPRESVSVGPGEAMP
jgi:hypothetical protein